MDIVAQCDGFLQNLWPYSLKLGCKGHDREGFPHGETPLSVNEQGVGLDFQIVFQPCLVSE